MDHARRDRLARNIFSMDEWDYVRRVLADVDYNSVNALRHDSADAKSAILLEAVEVLRGVFRRDAENLGLEDPFE